MVWKYPEDILVLPILSYWTCKSSRVSASYHASTEGVNESLLNMTCRSGFSNVVWSTTPAHARDLEAMSPKEFGEAVTHALYSPAHSSSHGFPLVPKPPDFLKAVAPKVDLQRLKFPEFLQAADPSKVLGSSSLFGAAAGAEIPPVVTAWEGRAPQSFPLSVQHAGRYAH